MGLDQYAYTRHKDVTGDDVKGDEIAYWRKHNRLQGWMENLYYSKNPTGKEFNCVKLFLTLEDIEALEKDIIARNLPATQGFFFGSDSYEHAESGKPYADYDMDKRFITVAKAALATDREVYYTCWW